jgi:hypothetical protein
LLSNLLIVSSMLELEDHPEFLLLTYYIIYCIYYIIILFYITHINHSFII